MTPPTRRMRSTSISLGITALMASSLTGCATSADYAAVCVDPDTQEAAWWRAREDFKRAHGLDWLDGDDVPDEPYTEASV